MMCSEGRSSGFALGQLSVDAPKQVELLVVVIKTRLESPVPPCSTQRNHQVETSPIKGILEDVGGPTEKTQK